MKRVRGTKKLWSSLKKSTYFNRVTFSLFLLAFAVVGYAIFHTQAANLSISLQNFASGLSSPVDIAFTGSASDNRMFVVQKTGQIKIVRSDGAIVSTPFLDIDNLVLTDPNEQGLLGLAFHPNYGANGYFFVTYTNNAGDLELNRFTRSTTSPDQADPDSRKLILMVPHPVNVNHNGGGVRFGPDGYLYYSTGDGGAWGDQQNSAQNKNALLGKILRLDINSTGAYNVPSTNPFVGIDGRDEVWAWGLRNPWRFNFDRQTGDMFIGDVGQDKIEEIDFQPAGTAGRNYGWRCYEGLSSYNTSGCGSPSSYIAPISQYDHSSSRCSVTGGYRYRGSAYPAMKGYYLFADYCSGHLYSLTQNGSGWTTETQGQFSANISSFGEDPSGELFASDVARGFIYRLRTPTGSSDTTAPTVNLTAPLNGATLSGNVALSATASDDTVVTKVDFLVDGAVVNSDSVAPYSYNWNSAGVVNGSHTIAAKASDGAGNSKTSSVITVTTSNTSSLPAPWQNRDIGAVGFVGAAAYSNGNFNIQASGTDIWNTSDEFHFVYQALNGDGQITARVTGLENTDPYAKAGVMIRESLDPGAKNVTLTPTPGNLTILRYRLATGGTSAGTTNQSSTIPTWVRLVRTGNTFNAYTSQNGEDWTHMGTQVLAMNSNVYIGLAVSAHNNSEVNHASLSNVVVGIGVPSVELITPGHSDTISGNFNVTATATDDIGITKVEFYVDDVLVATDTTAPYSFTWNTATYSNGIHTVAAFGYDASGNTGTHTHITTTQNTVTAKPGDLNGSGKVDITDLSIVLSNYGKSGSAGDASGDGKVDITDLSIVLSNYGN